MLDFKDMLHAEFTSNSFRIIFLGLIFLWGISIGSFLNVVILRVPKGESLIKRSSHCMTCGAKIRPIDLIPVFSWLMLRGKCHNCGEKISARYPIVESLNGLLYVLTFWVLDINAKAIITCLLMSLLVVVAFMDWDTMEINEIVLAIILALAVPMHLLADDCVSIKSHILGALVISVPFFIIGEVSRPIIKKKYGEDFRAIELGDTLLMVAAGAVVGMRVIIVSTLIGLVAAAIGGVINKAVTKESKFAFGPFLSIGIAIGALWGEKIADWYVGLLTFE
ncbi:MAG: prepilin peptidase [Ruminococcus sp.]|jgi:leader peptidase (prepilin peptidase)/N-methyltransferase|nr:prepilin peptidase [Ruminococcus sp.]